MSLPNDSTENNASQIPDTAWGGQMDVLDDEDEQRVLYQALDSFYQYAKAAHLNCTHLRRQSFYSMPSDHWMKLAKPPISFLDTLNAVDDAIDHNAELAGAILKCGIESFSMGVSGQLKDIDKAPWKGTAKSNDLDKARSTLRQFYRDWSAEGEPEREACFGPIIKDLLVERKKGKFSDEKPMAVLVPGAGLGRLVFDLCLMGFNVEGNEISYHMLIASSYILNYCPGPGVHTIFPWCHDFSNHKTRARQLQSVKIPDVHPGMTLQGLNPEQPLTQKVGEMSMSASDFICLYSDEEHKDAYDAVATVFFIDTAPNLIRYIDTIRNCLKSGGIWTNIGPLLWHFDNNIPDTSDDEKKKAIKGDTAGIADPGSVELANDEVITLITQYGFNIESIEEDLHCGYIQDKEAMLQNTYQASHWVARKI